MIELGGLTKQDVQLCDLIWNCDSVEAVDAMIAALPTAEYRSRAETLRALITAAALDEYMEVSEYVTDTLDRISRS